MKIGDAGEALSVSETEEAVSEGLMTSPVLDLRYLAAKKAAGVRLGANTRPQDACSP